MHEKKKINIHLGCDTDIGGILTWPNVGRAVYLGEASEEWMLKKKNMALSPSRGDIRKMTGM